MNSQKPATNTLGLIAAIASKLLGAALFLILMIVFGGFAFIWADVFFGPVIGVAAFLLIGGGMAFWLIVAFYWIVGKLFSLVFGVLRENGLIRKEENVATPENKAEIKTIPRTGLARERLPREPRPGKEAQKEPFVPAKPIENLPYPGKILFKKQLGLKDSLHVHERGLVLHRGVMSPVMVASMPISEAVVQVAKESGINKFFIRKADGGVFCETQNFLGREARKTKDRIEAQARNLPGSRA